MNKRTLALLGLIALAAAARLVQAVNIAPITAIAVFCGMRFKSRLTAWAVPLTALLATDLLKDVLHSQGLARDAGIYPGMWSTYGSTALVAVMAFFANGSRSASVIGATTLGGSLLFFALSNLAYWAEGALYPYTLGGLAECFVAALPFFRNSLLGDVVFSTALFGVWALAEAAVPALRGEPELMPAS